ncbi:cytolysin ABC transporter precursor [Fervidicella metallireducens AeB]|uniref:Cytolysin ABC transporter n=1 Tax=Fervidicella metallireducens AeB TaxID=1403537 RepID=A0A017RTV8_9CLOT|nr:ABC transporter permease [Fervidicella metallireducens]EYE88082.1 cytolysin ABC transporter precursor [Fervidicella metallireducens AeB]
MNIVNIFIKEIKQNIRDKKALTMMMLFPMVLILVLGSALGGVFDKQRSIEEINVLYINKSNNQVAEAFNSFLDKGKDIGIVFYEAENEESALDCIRGIKEQKYSCYIKVSNDKIEVYENKRFNLNSNIVSTILSAFVDRYNLVVEIAKVNPFALKDVAKNNYESYAKVVSLDGERKQRAKDYYAVTMTTLFTLYGALYGAWAMKSEKVMKTGGRLLSSPIESHEIFIGKLLASVIFTFIQMTILVYFSKFVVGAYWGEAIGTVLMLILSETIMSVSFGLGMSFIIKNPNSLQGILNSIIPFVAFLGGAYVPIQQLDNRVLNILANISPLKWINDAAFKVINIGDFSLVSKALMINLGFAGICLITASVLSRREVM